MLPVVKELLDNMKTTSGCRFNASKRLQTREQDLTRLTAMTSAFVVGLTVLPYFLHLPSGTTDRLNLTTIFFTLVILVSSLLQYSSRHGVNAEQHHRCALEISQRRRDLKLAAETANAEIAAEYTSKYNAIIDRYSINHDNIDYCQYQADRPDDFKWVKWYHWVWIYTKLVFFNNLINATLIVLTLLLLYILFKVGLLPWDVPLPS